MHFSKSKRIVLALLLLAGFVFSCRTTTEVQTQGAAERSEILDRLPTFDDGVVDGVLATVGDQVILLSDFQRAVFLESKGQTKLLADGRLEGGALSAEQANQIFESIVNQKILQIKAKDLGFEVSEEELTQRIDEFLKQQGFAKSDLEQQLQNSGVSFEEYRKDFRNGILKQQVIGRVIVPLVSVSNDEVNGFYLQQTKQTKQIKSVNLRSLVIHIPENFRNTPLDFPLVKKVSSLIAEKKDFADLATEYSMSAEAKKTGGLLPSKSFQDLPPELRQKMANLTPGDVVGPISLAGSVFFFQYIGAEFSNDSDLKKNFNNWKNKLQEVKFGERFGEYLKNERAKLRVVTRDFSVSRA